MNKIPFIVIGTAVLLGALLLVGCRKKDPPSTDDIDGGVRRDQTDPTAPKNITSKEITSFDCVFSTVTLDEEYGFEGRVYTLKAKLKDGRVFGSIDYYTRGGEGRKTDFEADAHFMESLYGIVSGHDLAKHNGYSYDDRGAGQDR